jgi:proline iminopeptidase
MNRWMVGGGRWTVCAALLIACAGSRSGSTGDAARSGFVDVPGARLHYGSIGRGEPVIVVHGGPGMDHSYLRPGMDELARTHRVVFYDQRGSGRTEGEVSRATVNLDAFLADISAIADSLRLGRFTLLGHSFGGLLAIQYATRHPERLRALVLMNTVEPGRRYVIPMNDIALRKRTAQDSIDLHALMRSPGLQRRDTAAVNALLRLSFRTLFADRALASRLRIELDPRTTANMGPVAANLVGSMGTFDFWPLAARIATPTLIIQGVEDAMPVQMVRELQKTIAGSELVLVEGAGHFPFIEKPGPTFEAIRRFLTNQ